jgi:hypothetical protein
VTGRADAGFGPLWRRAIVSKMFFRLAMIALTASIAAAPAAQIRVQTIDGAAIDALAVPPTAKAIVFLFTSTDCPISNRYAPEIRRIVETFAAQGVEFRLVYPSPADRPAAIRDHMASFGYSGSLQALRDPKFALVKYVKATVTPEAAVVVRGRVAYLGRIDDRYVDLGLERPAPTTHDLADALTAVLAGQPVAHPATQAVGCFIADMSR